MKQLAKTEIKIINIIFIILLPKREILHTLDFTTSY